MIKHTPCAQATASIFETSRARYACIPCILNSCVSFVAQYIGTVADKNFLTSRNTFVLQMNILASRIYHVVYFNLILVHFQSKISSNVVMCFLHCRSLIRKFLNHKCNVAVLYVLTLLIEIYYTVIFWLILP